MAGHRACQWGLGCVGEGHGLHEDFDHELDPLQDGALVEHDSEVFVDIGIGLGAVFGEECTDLGIAQRPHSNLNRIVHRPF